MTGKPSRFGIDMKNCHPALIKRLKTVSNNGIHLYLGSQILSDEQLIANYRTGLDIISKHYEKFYTGRKLDYVFGGGLRDSI